MAYARKGEKNGWALFLLILAGIVLGGFIGSLASEVSFLKWINFGYEFGQETPLVLDFKVIKLTFMILFNITVASLLGIALAIFLYRRL